MRNSLSSCGKQDQPDLHPQDLAATDWEEILPLCCGVPDDWSETEGACENRAFHVGIEA